MVRRLICNGHDCVVFDMVAKAVAKLAKQTAVPSSSLGDLAKKLSPPRTVWLMVPAAVVDNTIADVVPHLEADDVLIDGGNSYYVDDIRHCGRDYASTQPGALVFMGATGDLAYKKTLPCERLGQL